MLAGMIFARSASVRRATADSLPAREPGGLVTSVAVAVSGGAVATAPGGAAPAGSASTLGTSVGAAAAVVVSGPGTGLEAVGDGGGGGTGRASLGVRRWGRGASGRRDRRCGLASCQLLIEPPRRLLCLRLRELRACLGLGGLLGRATCLHCEVGGRDGERHDQQCECRHRQQLASCPPRRVLRSRRALDRGATLFFGSNTLLLFASLLRLGAQLDERRRPLELGFRRHR